MGPSVETLLLELYEYRTPSTHSGSDVDKPFENVPSALMHELDGAYLILKAQENEEEGPDIYLD